MFPGRKWLHEKEQAAPARESEQAGERFVLQMNGSVSPEESSQNFRKQREAKRNTTHQPEPTDKKTRQAVERTQTQHEACGKETIQIQK